MYKSHRSAPARVFDHLYDPLFTTSGYKDVWRRNQCSLTASAPMHIFPNYNSMFTDLPRRQRNFYLMQQNQLPHYPFNTQNLLNPKAATVSGADRAKFFNLPLSNIKTVRVQLDLQQTKSCANCVPSRPPSPEALFKTIACQTQYREQSAQTRPWMPDAVIEENRPDTPEIVHLASLIQGDGIPGVFECGIVERSRKRREWEKSLPPVVTASDWNKRRVILEAFEWEQWIAREDQIDYCQNLRLNVVEKLVNERKTKMEHLSTIRITSSVEKMAAAKEDKLKKLRQQHQRTLRRLQMDYKKISKKYKTTNIASDHIDPASNLYGPQRRFGVHPKHSHFMAYKTDFQARLDGLHLMQTKPINLKRFVEPHRDLTLPKGPLKEVKQGLVNDKFLQHLYESLKALRYQKDINTALAQCLTYIKKEKSALLTTPNASEKDIDNERYFQNSLIFQNIIKGRAVQKIIFEGRKQCRKFLTEIQSTHQLSSIKLLYSTKNDMSESRKLTYMQQTRLIGLLRAESQIQEVINQAEGTSLSFLLDFLDKELIRLVEQKRAHALCMLAEKERSRREAGEAGQRVNEEVIRNTQGDIYKKIASDRQNTATIYLENVLIECFDKIAATKAREKIQNIVRQIDEEADNPTSANVVGGLLSRCVIPDIIEEIIKEDLLNDAHSTIFGNEADDENYLLKQFLEEIVTPRSTSSSSNLSSVESDVSKHEANRVVRKAINKTMRKYETSRKKDTYEVLDNIIRKIIPSSPARSQRSEKNDELCKIINEITENITNIVNQDYENNADDEEYVVEKHEDKQQIQEAVEVEVNKYQMKLNQEVKEQTTNLKKDTDNSN